MLAMVGGASSADDAASRLHLLPFIVDGEGIQSRLLITNISESASHCSLDFTGPDLDADRFEDLEGLVAEGTRATFELAEDGGNLVWTSEGARTLTFGYAKLDCAEPVVAQVLFTVSAADELVSMATMSSARKASRFQFSVIPQIGSLVLIVANDADLEAACEIALEARDGTSAGEATFSVPAMSSVFQIVDEVIHVPEGLTGGAAELSCDQEVAATGFPLREGAFAVLSPAIFPPMSATDPLAEPPQSPAGEGDNGTPAQTPEPEPEPPVTEPPVTEPPVTEPPVTEPPVTEPPVTEPPVAEPPVAEPPVAEPPVTEPLVTEPPVTEPPVIEPPVIEPPVTEPAVTEPPVTEPPVTEPPVTEPPVTEPPVIEPPVTEPVLAGLSVSLRLSRGRGTSIRLTPQPADADILPFSADVEPNHAVTLCCFDVFPFPYIQFRCNADFTGNVRFVFKAERDNIWYEDSANYFCE